MNLKLKKYLRELDEKVLGVGKEIPEPILIVDGHYGIYAWKTFAERFDLSKLGFTKSQVKEYKEVLSDIDNEDYFEVASEIKTQGKTKDGFYAYQVDGDIWLIHEDYDTSNWY